MSIKSNIQKSIYIKFHKETSVQSSPISSNNFTYKLILEVINKYFCRDMTVLDVGCGAGTLCFYMASQSKTVLGIDIASNAIQAARKSVKKQKLNNITFLKMDFPSQVPKKRFDFIICTEVIEHLKDDKLAVNRIEHLLNKGGIAIISVPSKNAPLFKLGYAQSFDKRVGHLRRYSDKELVNLFKKRNFVILETKKTEGIIRNFLFLNSFAGKSIRFIKLFFVDLFSLFDELTVPIFGESQLFIVVKRT